jgi:hypothetical protein
MEANKTQDNIPDLSFSDTDDENYLWNEEI